MSYTDSAGAAANIDPRVKYQAGVRGQAPTSTMVTQAHVVVDCSGYLHRGWWERGVRVECGDPPAMRDSKAVVGAGVTGADQRHVAHTWRPAPGGGAQTTVVELVSPAVQAARASVRAMLGIGFHRENRVPDINTIRLQGRQ